MTLTKSRKTCIGISMTTETWRETLDRVGLVVCHQRIKKVSYETIRRWARNMANPEPGKHTSLLLAAMKDVLGPDEYEAFKRSLSTDLIGEA